MLYTASVPSGDSPLIADENRAVPLDTSGEKNRTKRYRQAKVTKSEIVAYNTDRIAWIQAGCPDSFHEWRNK